MSKYVLIFYGGAAPNSEDEFAKSMGAWNKWLRDLGNFLVDPGNPFGGVKTVGKDGVSDGSKYEPSTGYAIIEAESMLQACELTKDCPVIDLGGRVEVYQIFTLI